MPLAIRHANLGDAPVIVEFNRLLAEESEGLALDPAVLGPGVAEALQDAHKGMYYLAEDESGPLGQIMFTTEWSDWRNGWIWWIQSVYVRAEARRQGVFRALYEHVYEAARSDPAVVGLRLYVEQENHAARQTYARLGMQQTGYIVLQKWPL